MGFYEKGDVRFKGRNEAERAENDHDRIRKVLANSLRVSKAFGFLNGGSLTVDP